MERGGKIVHVRDLPVPGFQAGVKRVGMLSDSLKDKAMGTSRESCGSFRSNMHHRLNQHCVDIKHMRHTKKISGQAYHLSCLLRAKKYGKIRTILLEIAGDLDGLRHGNVQDNLKQ